jgi:hypothetical protein
MKRFLFFLLMFMQGCVAYAASPGFGAFNLNQFSTNNNLIALKDGLLVTNLTLNGTSTNLLEIYDSNNDLKFYIDTNGYSFPSLWINDSGSNAYVSTNSYASSLWLLYPPTQTSHGSETTVFQSATNVSRYTQSISQGDNEFAIYLGQYLSGTNALQGLVMYAGGQTPDVLLDPSTDYGLTPFILNARLPISSGNLFEVRNGQTNKFYVTWDGNTTAGDTTVNNLTINTNVTVNNNITVKGNATLNVVTANSGTITNDLTVQGNYIGTIDPTVTGTTLKLQKSLKLQFPRYIDGAGCTYSNTNDYTALTFMLPQFSGSGATNANYCDFAFRVPSDLDTSKDLTASLTIRLTAADTSGHTYDVGMVSIANSSGAAGTPANFVALTIAGDASGASGDIESVSAVTLTDWRSNLTAGQWCLLRLNRDGANDASAVASNLMELEIFYWATQ